MQRNTILLLLSLLILSACGSDGEQLPAIPTIVPTLATDGEVNANSPRIAATPARQVPPTWTPSSQLAVPTRLTPPPETVDGDRTTAGASQTTGDGETYVVQAGDTLAEIAADYGVDLDLLAEVNAIENIDVIEVGQELFIPQQ